MQAKAKLTNGLRTLITAKTEKLFITFRIKKHENTLKKLIKIIKDTRFYTIKLLTTRFFLSKILRHVRVAELADAYV